MKHLGLALLLAAGVSGAALAAPPVVITDPAGANQAAVNGSGQLSIICSSGCAASSTSNTGSAVPAQATYDGINVAGTLRGQTGTNPTGVTYAASTDLTSINGTTLLGGAGAAGAGAPRLTVAQDTTTIAGAAPGTAGSASANVITVQGIASATPIIENQTQINGSAVVTAATGVQKVGVSGNTGAALDAAGQNVASPANELLVGCQFNTAPTTITTTNMSPLQCSSKGEVLAQISQGGTAAAVGTAADGGTALTALAVENFNLAFNGSTWDRMRLDANKGLLVDNVDINGSAIVTAATGVQKVGVVGNTGATLDAAVGASTAPTNGIMELGQYNTTIPAPTAAQSVARQIDSAASEYVNTETRKATYTAVYSGAMIAGDTVTFFGSGTKTIRVTRVRLSGFAGTAGILQPTLIVRSTADTAGTCGATTGVPLDSNFAAATATFKSCSVAPTPGTTVGTVRADPLFLQTTTSPSSPAQFLDYTFGGQYGTALVLRGTGQGVVVNTISSANTLVVEIDWTEE